MITNQMQKFIDYYVNLLIIQYHNKPKAQATIRAFLRPLAEVFQLYKDLENAFNIETAEGVQLDIVAKYFGVKRTYNNIVFDRLYHNYQYIDGYVDGLSFQTVKNPGDGGTWTLETKNKSYYDLSDKELRLLIKLRIIGLNNELLTYAFFYNQLFSLFGTEIYAETDQNDVMSMIFYFDQTTNIGKLLHNFPEYFPVPAAVGATNESLQSFTKYFTSTLLQINGGLAYNSYQASFNLLGNDTGATVRLLSVNQDEGE
jgi:hypothetical protein